MIIVKAIDPQRDEYAIVFQIQIISWETLKMIEVYKCPKCGHSEKLDN